MLDFIQAFYDKVKPFDYNWESKAIITPDNRLYSLGSDSKLLGRIFELLATPIIKEIAAENELSCKESEKQTVYPDFTLMKSSNDTNKIAIDIKSTYRSYPKEDLVGKFKFTLGSFASFMRNDTKNIQYSYSDYTKHYVIGFVYDRNPDAKGGFTCSIDEIDTIELPYKNVGVFIQEKYKIAGEKPGSGNTENIGSISTNNIDHFISGNGPFSVLGEELFNIYWKSYPEYRSKEKPFTDLESFFKWYSEDTTKLHAIYKKWKQKTTL